ncbi:MAG: hypothetical protein M3Q36_02235 [bacterium]|nr:hypothetical protein [bacterium]
MKKPIIAVDIDDVLSQSVSAMLRFSQELYGQSLSHDDYDEDLSIMWQVSKEEAEERWLKFLEQEPMRHYDVIESAVDVLTKLKQKYTLLAVTSRRQSLVEITEEWLESNYPNVIDKVVSSRIYGEGKDNAHSLTKAEILQEVEADYLVDDQFKHCLGATEVGVKALLFGGYPWNNHQILPQGIVRVKDWQAVLEYFENE